MPNLPIEHATEHAALPHAFGDDGSDVCHECRQPKDTPLHAVYERAQQAGTRERASSPGLSRELGS